MQKYQQMFMQMQEENKDLFDNFKSIHDAYLINPEVNQAKFNQIGGEVTDIIRDYERRLCGKMSSGSYSKFSQNLSEKFWGEVRKIYRKIDFVGVK